VECGACGAHSPSGKRFCLQCGAPLAQMCSECGAPVVPGARFCGDCGAALTVDPPSSREGQPAATGATSTAQPVAERRMCSVLFCDLVGFTPLSESRDPEEVRELLSRYFETARTVVGRYGGVVEKFIGDAVMAVWGTPVATESDAERAVRAALDLVDEVGRLGAEAGVDGLAARAGVVTGEVAVTVGATNEGMVAGDAVNTAARVQAAARSGQVLVDAGTRRLSAGAIGFDDAGEHTLKGKAAPQELWRATRVLSGVGGSQRVDGLEAPLTGREMEIRTVRDLFEAARERRIPRLVVVSGPAGVGKSRLGWEFEKYVDGLVGTTRWHRGRCLSYGEGVAFWALAEMVRQRLGIAEEDPPETAAVKLADGVRTWVPDQVEQPYVGARLSRLLGVPYADDPGSELPREELFAGWRTFFERMAAVDPVVLLVEDAHHGDAGLLDFLDHLVDWSSDLPIYLLVFARPEIEQVRPGFGTGRNRVLLTLDPLDAASMTTLVEELVPGMPAATRDAIVAQAQGIPLFAVETVRSLIDRDVVQPVEGVYRLVGDVGELEVPDSLHALLAARLDGLPAATRRLVSDAAVLGTSFPEEALVGVSGLDRETVHVTLAELLRREVLAVSADPLSPERGAYRFAQEMLRQVAYDTLSRRDRKARHLTVAAHLRETFPGDGDEVVDVVARHYLDALAAVPEDPDADDIRRLAVDTLVRAAERAARTGSQARASSSYASAAELVEARDGVSARSAGLLYEAADAAMDSGEVARVVELAEPTIERFETLGDARAAARGRVLLGRALIRLGRYADARPVVTSAVEALRTEPDADTVDAMTRVAAVEIAENSPGADSATVEAVRLAEGLALGPDVMVGVFQMRGTFLMRAGRQAEGAMHLREAARYAEQSDQAVLLGRALSDLANVLAMQDPRAAVELVQRAVSAFRRVGDRYTLAIAFLNIGVWRLELGEWDEVADMLAPGGEADTLAELAWYIRWLQAVVASLRGDAATAESLAAGFDPFRKSEDPEDRALLAVADLLTAAAAGRREDALHHCTEALSYADQLSVAHESVRWAWPLAARAALELDDRGTVERLLAMLDAELPGRIPPVLRAERSLVRARLAAVVGDPAAGQALAAAVQEMRTSSPPHLLAQGLLDQAEHLAALGDTADAAASVAEARAIGARLGAAAVLTRSDLLATTAAPA
jgi:class 3 adenylate cyclase/tetratricopeptide (TPR) repeat protein